MSARPPPPTPPSPPRRSFLDQRVASLRRMSPHGSVGHEMFLAQVAIALVRIVLGFFGFWLVWRVILPWLPGPKDVRDRIAPYACFFTDPFIEPLRRLTGLPSRAWAGGLLVAVAAAMAALPT